MGALLVFETISSESADLGDDGFNTTSNILVGGTQEANTELVFQNLLTVGVAPLDTFDLVNTAIHFDREFDASTIKI